MNQTISVIVPVYNVEAYLPACIDSICTQDYEDLEIILIDDGSKDHSGELCDRYAEQDSRIRVIHQANAGAAAAKNAGLRLATGTYLSFVDSDDYLEPGAYRFLIEKLRETGADAVQGGFREVYRNRQEEQLLKEEILEGEAYLLRFLTDFTCALLWNKLYRREIFDGVFFEEGHRIDDEYFTYQGFLKPRKVVRCSRIVYNYRKRVSGAMGDPAAAEQRILDGLDFTQKRREKILELLPHLRRDFDHNYIDLIWCLAGNVGSTKQTLKVLKKRLWRYLWEKGNSAVPAYLIPGLAKLAFAPVWLLLRIAEVKRSRIDLTDYFD